MKALLLLLLFTAIAGCAGRTMLGRCVVLEKAILEKAVVATAFGLGAAGTGLLALGLIGRFAAGPIAAWWTALALFGLPGARTWIRDIRLYRRLKEESRSSKQPELAPWERSLPYGTAIILAGCSGLAIIACFQPPAGHEWDALAYHLADPKLFLLQGRISSLPTEHHSNFPFLMEMLYAVGLVFDGYALANLFHFLMGALTVAALIAAGSRLFSPTVGYLAAILFATTPLVLWEAGAAYNDLALGLYTTLATISAVSATVGGRESGSSGAVRSWLLLAGAAAGFALGTKYLGLLTPGLLAVYLPIRRVPWRAAVAAAGVALVIGAPWYVKSWVLTSNPVYPYFFRLFPHSIYWSADRAVAYQSEQNSFGLPHSLTAPGEALRGLAVTPWALLVSGPLYANRGDFTFSALVGGLYGAFGFALLLLRRPARAAIDLALLALANVAAWFFLAQVGRYLIPTLPVLALAAAYAAWRLTRTDAEPAPLAPVFRFVTPMAFAGQFALILWSAFALPTSGRTAMDSGLMPAAASASEGLRLLEHPEAVSQELARRLDVYAACRFINRTAPPKAGVILYDETRGFYLDRPYLWGNGEHSSYIPYATMRSGADLTQWLERHGIGYALVNMNWSPYRAPEIDPRAAPELALRRGYIEAPFPPGSWRAVLADALRRGFLKPVTAAEGVLVLEVRPTENVVQ